MPPGWITILRKRNSRPLIFAISLPRSIAPSVVSVTPTAAKLTASRAFGLLLSAGHSPACALTAKPVAVTNATAAIERSQPRLTLEVNILISSVSLQLVRAVQWCDDEADVFLKEMPGCSGLDSGALFILTPRSM